MKCGGIKKDEMIFSSISPLRVVSFFLISCGLKPPFLSLGTAISTGPPLVLSIFLLYPFWLFFCVFIAIVIFAVTQFIIKLRFKSVFEHFAYHLLKAAPRKARPAAFHSICWRKICWAHLLHSLDVALSKKAPIGYRWALLHVYGFRFLWRHLQRLWQLQNSGDPPGKLAPDATALPAEIAYPDRIRLR